MKRSNYVQLFLKEQENRKQKMKKEQEQKQLKLKPKVLSKQAPITIPKLELELREQFEYSCYKCKKPIVYNTLWLDDFTNRYIPLDKENMKPHYCNTKTRQDKNQHQRLPAIFVSSAAKM